MPKRKKVKAKPSQIKKPIEYDILLRGAQLTEVFSGTEIPFGSPAGPAKHVSISKNKGTHGWNNPLPQRSSLSYTRRQDVTAESRIKELTVDDYERRMDGLIRDINNPFKLLYWKHLWLKFKINRNLAPNPHVGSPPPDIYKRLCPKQNKS